MFHDPGDCHTFRMAVRRHRRDIILAADIIEECQQTLPGTVIPDAPAKMNKRLWDAALRRLLRKR